MNAIQLGCAASHIKGERFVLAATLPNPLPEREGSSSVGSREVLTAAEDLGRLRGGGAAAYSTRWAVWSMPP